MWDSIETFFVNRIAKRDLWSSIHVNIINMKKCFHHSLLLYEWFSNSSNQKSKYRKTLSHPKLSRKILITLISNLFIDTPWRWILYYLFMFCFSEYRPSYIGKTIFLSAANKFSDKTNQFATNCSNDRQGIHVWIWKSIDHTGK